jgi:hypothetical protein
MIATIYKNIYDTKNPHYLSIDKLLERIDTGKSKEKVEAIRATLDKEKRDKLKRDLPCVVFSGKYGDRTDTTCIQNSGFIVLDFDKLENLRDFQTEIISNPYCYACWVSPSGYGLKALFRIANPKKHREHFGAIADIFPIVDKSGVNESRVCYESYDPEIYINRDAQIFKTIKKVERIEQTKGIDSENETFNNIMKWLTNKGDAFRSGERNLFIFKLAGACSRFGIHQESAESLILSQVSTGSDFTDTEAKQAIRSAYKCNKFGNAQFENTILIDKVSKKEIEIDLSIYDLSIKPKDVIYGIDVKDKAMDLYDKGYEKLDPIGIIEIDERYKMKRGEITLFTGHGNMGKTTMLMYILLIRAIVFKEKFAIFSPENQPAEEFYDDFVEILVGASTKPENTNRVGRYTYENAYDLVSKHFFNVYPIDNDPTPEYIQERFLELIIKEKIDGVVIDPFNQLHNDYESKNGRDDRYLSEFLSKYKKFSVQNNVFGLIVAHPKAMQKYGANDYPCPDVYDLAGGAMWNNKMDNIYVYHRPLASSDPSNAQCEFKALKIKRQKQVGKKGTSLFEYDWKSRRFKFSGLDSLATILRVNEIDLTPSNPFND